MPSAPRLFFKAQGWRVVGHGDRVRVREDSHWNVPEPELVLVVNSRMEVVGYTAGNDVSSRDIEGENPLYLPQAKVYDGSCSLGPGIVLAGPDSMRDLPIAAHRARRRGRLRGRDQHLPDEALLRGAGGVPGQGARFPTGAFLMTGTGIVPEEDFTSSLGTGSRSRSGISSLENEVPGSDGS